ncbi:NUDIX domain-containing protein [Macrococcus sp. DPC7161]|nr:NUDIX domain-containing protein [Macrococcus sp. DPC7161]
MMDLTLLLDQQKLNIRTSVLIKRGDEWLIHQGKKEKFATSIGGRIKLLEDSRKALAREIEEELNIKVSKERLQFRTIVENFFSYNKQKYHELLFIYQLEITDELGFDKIVDQPDETFDFFFVNQEELKNIDMKPELLKDIMLGKVQEAHIINYDENFGSNNDKEIISSISEANEDYQSTKQTYSVDEVFNKYE